MVSSENQVNNKPECLCENDSMQWIYNLFEYTFEPIFILKDGRIYRANHAAAELIAVKHPQELKDKFFDQFVFGEFHDQLKQWVERSPKVQIPLEMKHIQMIRMDSYKTEVDIRAIPVVIENVWYIQVFCRDVSFIKKMEQSRQESEDRYRHMVQKSPEPVLVHSDHLILYMNQAAMKLLRVERTEQIIGKSVLDFFQEADHQSVKKRMEQASHREYMDFLEYQLVLPGGGILFAEIGSTKVSEHLQPPLVQSVIRDITARKQTEELLRKSDKLSAIGQLAAGVAHEIRNPLTALKGFVQLLNAKHEGYQNYYEIMLSELERIHQIVNEFMVLAKPSPVVTAQHDLGEIINSVATVLRTQAILNNVQIVIKIGSAMPPAACDANQIKQVLVNIIKNAIESMPHGGNLYISADYIQESCIRLRIQDEGCGIPELVLARIGDPFYTTKENGTGLGLMICERIVQSHHGQLKIYSKENEGTTVEVLLPVNAEKH